MILSIVVLTGYAGQLSLAQWALGGLGALIAGRLVQSGWPIEVAIPLGIVGTVMIGAVFALPAIRARGVNLAVVTLGLGFTVSEVVFANNGYIGGEPQRRHPQVGLVTLFGVEVDAFNHPHRWAIVSLVAFVGIGLVVANLRRSRTGRRLIAVRTNERAAASLGVSVFGVKLYAFAVSAGHRPRSPASSSPSRSADDPVRPSSTCSSRSTPSGSAVLGGLGVRARRRVRGPRSVGGLGDWVREGQARLVTRPRRGTGGDRRTPRDRRPHGEPERDRRRMAIRRFVNRWRGRCGWRSTSSRRPASRRYLAIAAVEQVDPWRRCRWRT